jgi:hypothetical protein
MRRKTPEARQQKQLKSDDGIMEMADKERDVEMNIKTREYVHGRLCLCGSLFACYLLVCTWHDECA